MKDAFNPNEWVYIFTSDLGYKAFYKKGNPIRIKSRERYRNIPHDHNNTIFGEFYYDGDYTNALNLRDINLEEAKKHIEQYQNIEKFDKKITSIINE